MDIESRLRTMERELRRLRLTVVCLLGGAAALLVSGAGYGVPEVIRAQRLEIVGPSGAPVVELDQYSGAGRITVRNADAHVNVRLSASQGGGTMATLRGEGRKIVELSATRDGKGVVTTYSALTGHRLVDVIANTRGGGAVLTYDARGQKLLALSALQSGDGVVAMYARDGSLRAAWPPVPAE